MSAILGVVDMCDCRCGTCLEDMGGMYMCLDTKGGVGVGGNGTSAMCVGINGVNMEDVMGIGLYAVGLDGVDVDSVNIDVGSVDVGGVGMGHV